MNTTGAIPWSWLPDPSDPTSTTDPRSSYLPPPWIRSRSYMFSGRCLWRLSTARRESTRTPVCWSSSRRRGEPIYPTGFVVPLSTMLVVPVVLLTSDQMMQTLSLDVGDMIQIKTTSLELAKLVKLQPQSTNFLDISDPKAVLEKAFRNFAALTKGDIFNFEYNDEIYHVAVLEVKPETEKMGVCMIETDVEVDFAAPVGYVEPEKQQRGSGTSTPRSVRGGVPAGGLLHSQGSMAQSINYNAIAPSATATTSRFYGEGQKLSKKGSKTSTPKPATPVTGSSVNAPAVVPLPRRTNGPMPLRLPPNKLFFGYEIKPVKTDADKEREKEESNRPHFAGQGQTLRGKRKGDVEEKEKAPEKKGPGEGNRLDGRGPKPRGIE
ncbi:Ubiquitin fusion degradation protein 1 [Colletotrichum tanaceti]|uniref:Ubiquitin fusion degradation protein 1 n=1 Tax=Colletotrichum tanaceti TaxID=1306861 RepID=A0A4U6X689_9PEZI|nr:Ubiquitin fusion degradation protein 1 [Colletotrichum tanaceti]TKW50379.1 Ubiquitin fusion degradation protein 1 [Colletotrichum tanaceti]